MGGLVARHLSTAGIAQRFLARSVSNAPSLPDSVIFPFSYADPQACAVALDGVETLLMVSATESANRLDHHRSFIDSALAGGVGHIVYTSLVGAAPDAVFTLAREHYATEECIRSTGLPYTFLRDNFYLDVMEALVGDDGVIRGPASTGRVAAVARADVARTAAADLTSSDHHVNKIYELSGPQAMTMTELARILSDVRGSAVTYYDERVAEAYESRSKWGAPDWQNDAWVTTYTAIAAGDMDHVSDDVTTLTGSPPLSLAQLLLSPKRHG